MFTEHLKKVVDNVEGGVAALIMGLDGIAVDDYATDEGDIQTIGMEFSFILTQIKKAAEILEIGGLKEIAIKAEQLTVAIRMLNDEYFLAVTLKADGNLGKARFLMRVAAPRLLDQL